VYTDENSNGYKIKTTGGIWRLQTVDGLGIIGQIKNAELRNCV
jgi:hypothetical protein